MVWYDAMEYELGDKGGEERREEKKWKDKMILKSNIGRADGRSKKYKGDGKGKRKWQWEGKGKGKRELSTLHAIHPSAYPYVHIRTYIASLSLRKSILLLLPSIPIQFNLIPIPF